MRFQSPRGMVDILPEDQPYWRHVTKASEKLARSFGYERLDPVLIEDTGLFLRSIGEGTDIHDKEMYVVGVLGKAEEKMGDLALRPEFTAGVMRAYLEHGLSSRPTPLRLYSLGHVFRHEAPQLGRYRQISQFNCEAIGSLDPALDLEIMLIAWRFFEDNGMKDLAFQVNSTGCPQCRPRYVEALRAYFAPHAPKLNLDDRRRLEVNPLRVLDSKAEDTQALLADAPQMGDYLCEECAAHFAALKGYLDALGRPYSINPRLVRGLDYYTKTVFEVWGKEGLGAQNALCGGGRYDGLIELLGGPPTPSVGFAAGIDRLVLSMKALDVPVEPLPGPQVLVAYLGADAKLSALQLLNDLREAGLRATATFGDRGLKAQFRFADRAGVPYTLVLGSDEVAQGVVSARDMAASSQTQVPRADIVAWLAERLTG